MLVKARADKERKCSELVNGDRCGLVVVGVEIGGRLSDEAETFLDHLASVRARKAPPIRQRVFHVATSWVAHARSCMQESVRIVSGFCGRGLLSHT